MPRHGENIYKRRAGRYEGRYVIGKTSTGKTLFGYIYGCQYTKVLHQYLSPLVKLLKDTPDTPAGAYEAGYRFCYDYERPASRTASSIKRGNMAKDAYYPKYI